MARVKKVATEILLICKENNIDIDYFKLQKLLYICQCVHYGRFNVPLCPELIYNWGYGGSFKEILSLFWSNNIDLECEALTLSQIKRIDEKTIKTYYYLLNFEKDTINFVLSKYSNMSFDDLRKLVKKDLLYDDLDIGNLVRIEKLNNYFITKQEIEELNNPIKKKLLK